MKDEIRIPLDMTKLQAGGVGSLLVLLVAFCNWYFQPKVDELSKEIAVLAEITQNLSNTMEQELRDVKDEVIRIRETVDSQGERFNSKFDIMTRDVMSLQAKVEQIERTTAIAERNAQLALNTARETRDKMKGGG